MSSSSSSSSSGIVDPRGRRVVAEMPVYLPPGSNRDRHKPPQRRIDEFWKKFTTKAPGKATTLLPKNEYAEKLARRAAAKEGGSGAAAQASFEEAATLCRAKVDKIIDECRRVNSKYRDPHFDLEFDLKTGQRDCLESLDNIKDDSSDSESDSVVSPRPPSPQPEPSRRHRRRHRQRRSADYGIPADSIVAELAADPASPRRPQNRTPGSRFSPKSVKRVGEIFDDPKFYIDGPTANDVRQGRDGDCWLMAALCTLSNKPGLIERICVHHDQDVGVYGFVFHRDGEWFSEVIDDKLYLTKPDYDEAMSDRLNIERLLWDDGRERPDSEEIYRKTYQSNSGALYFAQCENPNETWLPLLEKAYAKAHGDYAAIEGGFTGEGIEDLTGGVTSELFTTDILDKEHFWKNELMQVNKDFLFGCSTGLWGRGWGDRKGIVEQHAYSVMRAVEIDGERLVLLKNPWGKTEWKGPWSDGSKEWTPEWLQKLEHRFGDDGAFWISYKELLRKYQNFDRTRLFGPDWKITSIWTTLSVPWCVEYHDTKFAFRLAKPGPVVIVLSQLDDRYFRGLEGQYAFSLAFRVHKAGHDDYLVRTRGSYRMKRSVSVELDLEAGEYLVLVKIDAERYDEYMPPEGVVRKNAKKRREKLLRMGLAYDLAHSKAKIVETPEEKAAREAYEKRKKEKYRERLRKALMKERYKQHYQQTKQLNDRRKMIQRAKEKQKARAEKKEAEAKKREAERVKMVEEMEKKEAEARKKQAEKEGTGTKEEGDVDQKVAEKEEQEKKPEEPGKQSESATAPSKTVEKTEKKTEESGQVEGPQTETNAPQDATPGDQEGNKDGKAENPDQETSTDAGENTPTSNSGVLSAAGSAGEGGAPQPSEEAGPVAQNPGSAPPGDETKLESQTSFYTSFETITDSIDKPPQADRPEPAVDNSPPRPERQEEAEPSIQAKPEIVEIKVKKEGESGEAGPVRLPAEVESEIREMIGAFNAFGRSKGRLEALLGGQEPDRQRRQRREEDVSDYDSEPSRETSRQPSLMARQRLQPPNRHHYHRHHSRPPPPGPPPRAMGGNPRPPGMGGPPPPPLPPGRFGPQGGYVSDADSDRSDGVISIPSVSEISDRELDYRVEENLRQIEIPHQRPPPPVVHREAEDEFERDPWNAVAVVGLRVYYKVADEDKDKEIVTLRVIRPNPYELDEDDDEDAKKGRGEKAKEGEEGEKDETDEAKVLDLDDSAKDATVI